MSNYHWREKWQEKDNSGDIIEWAVKTPEGWAVKFAGLSRLYRYREDGSGISSPAGHLLPLPAPSRPWEKAEDVPEEAEWVRHDDLQGPRRITGITAKGLYLATNFHCWETLALFNARWSATRTGEYRECKVEGGGK